MRYVQGAPGRGDECAAEEDTLQLPVGFKPKKRGKYTVYCRKEEVMGTRFPVEKCYDEQGIREMLLEPNWRGVDDPIEKIWKLMDGYRRALVETDCTYGCPIGSLALELHEPDPPVRERLARNFTNWVTAIEECLDDAGTRLPPGVDRRALAEFVLTTMEGGVMLARSYRDIGYFDRAIGELKGYFNRLLRPAKPARRRQHKRKKGKSNA